MKDKNKIFSILIIALLLVGIVVVIVITGRSEKTEQITEQITQIEEIVVVDTEVPATEIQEASEPTEEAVVEEQAPPAPKAGLESTDPATVNLASGQLQLVEAFAFW
jgi:flagellar basal body-associated protein FliL